MAGAGTGPAGELLRLSGPMLLGNLFQQLYYLTDIWMIGRFLGQDATAAVGAVMPAVNLLLTLLIGLAGGASVLFSQRAGAGDQAGERRCVETAAVLWLAASAAVTALGLALSRPAVRALGVPPALREPALRYLTVVFAGTLFNSGYNTLAALRRGAGDAVRPMLFLAASAGANIALDYLFLVPLGLGTAGAALATALAQAMACAGLYRSVLRTGSLYRLWPGRVRPAAEDVRAILRLGLPAALQQAAACLAAFAAQIMVNSLGPQMIAGYAVALRVENFVALPAVSLEHSVCSLTGRGVGAGREDRITKALGWALAFSAVLGGGLFLLFQSHSGAVISLFLPGAGEAARLGGAYLAGAGEGYWALLCTYALGGVFRGRGRAAVPLAAALLGSWLIRLPVTWLLLRWDQSGGADALWLGAVLGWLAGLFLELAVLVRDRRRDTRKRSCSI